MNTHMDINAPIRAFKIAVQDMVGEGITVAILETELIDGCECSQAIVSCAFPQGYNRQEFLNHLSHIDKNSDLGLGNNMIRRLTVQATKAVLVRSMPVFSPRG